MLSASDTPRLVTPSGQRNWKGTASTSSGSITGSSQRYSSSIQSFDDWDALEDELADHRDEPRVGADGRRPQRREAERLASERQATGQSMPVIDVIKALSLAVDPPKKSGAPKKSGKGETVASASGKPVLRIDGADRKGIRLTLLSKGGATRQEAEEAVRAVLDQYWT